MTDYFAIQCARKWLAVLLSPSTQFREQSPLRQRWWEKGDLRPMPILLRNSAACFVSFLLSCSPVFATTLRCEIDARQQCQQAKGCTTAPAMGFNMVDISGNKYSRCDSQGCDTYEAISTMSGAYLSMEVSGRGMLAKLELETLRFLEIVTLAEVVYVSWGLCEKLPGN
jgi:hypothetical protein